MFVCSAAEKCCGFYQNPQKLHQKTHPEHSFCSLSNTCEGFTFLLLHWLGVLPDLTTSLQTLKDTVSATNYRLCTQSMFFSSPVTLCFTGMLTYHLKEEGQTPGFAEYLSNSRRCGAADDSTHPHHHSPCWKMMGDL